MYTISNRLKMGSIILMVIGLLGIGWGFLAVPSTEAEAMEMVAAHDDGHGGEHSGEASHGATDDHAVAAEHGEEAHEAEGGHAMSHETHVLHQLQNKPWAALYVAAFFFFMIALGVLAFYAIQRAAQAGWSPLLFRVMEGITAYIVPGGIIVFVILVLSVLHMNHLVVWMDPEGVAPDKLSQG